MLLKFWTAGVFIFGTVIVVDWKYMKDTYGIRIPVVTKLMSQLDVSDISHFHIF